MSQGPHLYWVCISNRYCLRYILNKRSSPQNNVSMRDQSALMYSSRSGNSLRICSLMFLNSTYLGTFWPLVNTLSSDGVQRCTQLCNASWTKLCHHLMCDCTFHDRCGCQSLGYLQLSFSSRACFLGGIEARWWTSFQERNRAPKSSYER